MADEDLARRFRIIVPFVALIMVVAVVLGLTLGSNALIPALVSGAVLGTIMIVLRFRSDRAARERD